MLSYNLTRPLSVSLYHHLRNDIEQGIFPAGSRMPSRRQIALDLGISLSTVDKALDGLEMEGLVEAVEKKGCFVLPVKTKPSDAFCLEPLKEDPKSRQSDFPDALWYKTMRLVMTRDADFLMQKSPAKGSARLRNVLADYLYKERGMQVQPCQIVIAPGCEGLYEILARMFDGRFDVILEEPCYAPIEAVYKASHVNIEKIPLSQGGLDEKQLEASEAQFLHVSPFFLSPSPLCASPARRRFYLDWIASRNGYLIEDDFNSEFIRPGMAMPTLYSMDDKGKVIYLNTFSKSMSSALRLGYMVLPMVLLDLYEQKAGMFSNPVTMLEQYTLAEFIESGSFARLIARRRRKA